MGGSASKIPDVIVKDRVIAQSSAFPWSINNGILANGNECRYIQSHIYYICQYAGDVLSNHVARAAYLINNYPYA